MRFEEIENKFAEIDEKLDGGNAVELRQRISDLESQQRRDGRTMVFLVVGFVLLSIIVWAILREGKAVEE